MTDQLTQQHYRPGNKIWQNIQDDLVSSGKELGALCADDLSPYDALHIGGRKATGALLAQLDLAEAQGGAALDIGAGLGGAARRAASLYDINVTGIDLTPEYSALARQLSAVTGLEQKTRFITGDGIALPFADGSFSRGWTIHTAMNIADKAGLYREIARVLVPGALFGIYDVIAAPGAEDATLSYPVPWAGSAAHSHLASRHDTGSWLAEAGLTIVHEQDWHNEGLAALHKLHARLKGPGKSAPGIALIMGPDTVPRIENLISNIERGLCTPYMVICRRA